ncbi:MAG: flippase [Pelobium sp.]
MQEENKSNYWLKSGMLNVLQNMSGLLFGIGSLFFLVKVLSKEEYGVWVLFTGTVTILNVFRDGLLRSAVVKFLSAASEEDKPKIITSSFTLDGILTTCIIILNFLFAHVLTNFWDTPELIPVFYLYNIVYVLSGILTQFNCIEQANLKYDGIFVTNTANQTVFFLVVLGCFIFKINITIFQLVIFQIVGNAISALIAYFYVRKYLFFAKGYHKEWVKKMFNYGKYAFGTSVSSILSGTVDQWMLGGLISPVASGVFNLAVRISNLIDIPSNAVATIVFPQSAKRMETEGKEAIKYLYERSVGVILSILIPSVILIYIFSDLIIYLAFGDAYADTGPLLRVMLFYVLLIPYGRQFGVILDSIGKTKTTFYMVVFIASFNLILNYILISSIGIMGAPYATLITNVVGFVIAQYILKKELNVSVWNTFVYAYYFYPEFYNKYVKPKLIEYKIIKGKS